MWCAVALTCLLTCSLLPRSWCLWLCVNSHVLTSHSLPGSVFAFLSCSGISLPVSQHLAWTLLLWLSRNWFSFLFLIGRVGCWLKKKILQIYVFWIPLSLPDSFLMDRKGRLKPSKPYYISTFFFSYHLWESRLSLELLYCWCVHQWARTVLFLISVHKIMFLCRDWASSVSKLLLGSHVVTLMLTLTYWKEQVTAWNSWGLFMQEQLTVAVLSVSYSWGADHIARTINIPGVDAA